MSAFRDIMSIVDPTAPKTAPAPKQVALAGAPKVVPHPAGGASGANQAPQLKRKASGSIEVNQVKVQRKDGASQPAQTNGVGRPIATPGATRPNPPAPISTVPYRGTAAPAGVKVASPVVRKPNPPTSTPSVGPKAAAPPLKPLKPATPVAAPPASAAPKKGYLALLQKAKEKDATKPAAPPVQNGPPKILTKKERLALKAEAKGKKPVVGASGRHTDVKGAALPEKKKSVEVGYQGTARPTKPPAPVGYRGTARPASAPASTSRNGTPTAKSKPKPAKGRHDGYADWSDLDDEDLEEEDDYASDASSDMEGGIWDVEQEEQLALKAAKQEDAEALAEEQRLKREKEARRKKLAEMSKQAAAKKKY